MLKLNILKTERWCERKKSCEAGGDQPAVFGTRVSVQSVPWASFGNHSLNGWLAWETAGAILKCKGLTQDMPDSLSFSHTHTLRKEAFQTAFKWKRALSETISRRFYTGTDVCLQLGCKHTQCWQSSSLWFVLDEPTCSSRLVTQTAVEVGTIFMAFCSKAYQCLLLTVSLEINIFPLKEKKSYLF